MNRIRNCAAVALCCLVGMTQTAVAQRQSGGDFEGVWRGSLKMDVLYDIPAEQIERLSQPVELEMRIFSRGGAELYFTSPNNEWEFSQQRDFRITLIGDNHGVIVARIPSVLPWENGIALNMTFADSSKDRIVLSWSRISVRNQQEFDGLDEMAFSGVTELTRTE